MAVDTDITDEELAALLRAYDAGEALSFKGIAEGVENSNFLLETTAGRFILTVYEKRVRVEDLPFFMGVMESLADQGVAAPRPVRTRDVPDRRFAQAPLPRPMPGLWRGFGPNAFVVAGLAALAPQQSKPSRLGGPGAPAAQ